MNLGILIQLIIMELTGRGYLGTAPSSSPTQEEKENCLRDKQGDRAGHGTANTQSEGKTRGLSVSPKFTSRNLPPTETVQEAGPLGGEWVEPA